MSRYRKRYRRNIGLERALQHIEDAKQLSAELGGTDKDVKEYFFNLPKNKLDKLFNSYGKQYGNDVKEYAIETFDSWKSGSRKMSGLVAGRLYNLLPPMMPMETKYSMVKVLWNKYGPKTNKVLNVGGGVNANEIYSEAKNYLIKTVQDWEVHENLKKRFSWLSSGDVDVYEKLLNHYKDLEKVQIIAGLKNKMPVLVDFINKNEAITTSLTETISIVNHKLEIKFNTNKEGISITDPELYTPVYNTVSENQSPGVPIFVWIIIGLFILIFIAGS